MLRERGIYRLPAGGQFVASKPLRMALAMVVLAGFAQEAVVKHPPKLFKKLCSLTLMPKMFMGSVLVASNGKTIFNNAYGMADLEWSIPNSPTTRFNIASMTKQFTAAAILLLEDCGKLKTSDSVKKYLPDAPASWNKITIYHLLTHTSGISDDAANISPGRLISCFLMTNLWTFSLANDGPTPTWDTSCSGICLKESWDRAMKASFKRIFSNPWG